ncbi:hypothetical protein HMN09_01079700 [Mycena chlorophos]|uniref:CxC2-like cysteine cluster KDZ transposase-associated domain-containing protein n=1 Tax=Mycena chlorophos TaxID=658473 RepID=A0A8H6SBX0_MYCCL|nr:hypothetical protein HMN09_01079700 [Mycena chlorophos]
MAKKKSKGAKLHIAQSGPARLGVQRSTALSHGRALMNQLAQEAEERARRRGACGKRMRDIPDDGYSAAAPMDVDDDVAHAQDVLASAEWVDVEMSSEDAGATYAESFALAASVARNHKKGRMRWELPEGVVVQKTQPVVVVDILGTTEERVYFLQHDPSVSFAMVRQGLFPAAPLNPSVAFTARTIALFQAVHLRCPRLGKQAFIRAFRPEKIRLRVAKELGRHTPNWRLANACPACTYKLKDEPGDVPDLMHTTCDGNNSAAFARRSAAARDYYIPREEVNKYGKDAVSELLKGFVPDPAHDEAGDGCGDTWENMKEEKQGKSWGFYDETGIFRSLCRHSFVLKICDMVKSGELAKYGLAITAELLEILHALVGGYDIGCKFTKWVHSHPILAKLAQEHHFSGVVGSFHGCSHCRECQLHFLPLYRELTGLEPYENCESWFSKSNALAATTRYASRFHRQQEIAEYCAHADAFDAYANLSSLLVSKYKHALEVLDSREGLEKAMVELGVKERGEFEQWLAQEKEALKRLSKEPEEETLHMEYYQKLVNLRDAEATVAKIRTAAIVVFPSDDHPDFAQLAKDTPAALEVVHELELRLEIGVDQRWHPGTEQWDAAATLVSERRYRRALDTLQAGMAGTGYKVWKHIAKAIQTRSKALRNLLTRYNDAARALDPPRSTMTWEEVINCAFLADFDLLRLGRNNIRDCAWTRAGAREVMDQHFRILRAEEERKRLDVEIRRLVTHMRDEDQFLLHHKRRLEAAGMLARAYQVRKQRSLESRFSAIHMNRLYKLSKLRGFTGCILPGEPAKNELLVRVPIVAAEEGAGNQEPELEDDDTDDEGLEGLQEALEQIVRITEDS